MSSRSRFRDLDPRIAEFHRITLAHPHLKRAEHETRLRIRQPAGAALVLLCGPTGVGKTTLLERMTREVNSEILPELAAEPVLSGMISLRAMAAEGTMFSWRDLYLRTLAALSEPFADEPIRGGTLAPADVTSLMRRKATVAELRERLIAVLRERRPPALNWDEAQHIGLNLRPEAVVQHMEVVKSLADESGVLIILSGTYELVGLRNLNGQLSRRSHDIHFPRYRADDPDERMIFDSFVRQLAERLPTRAADLERRLDDIYARTLGCVGNLKSWLTLALTHALDEGTRRLEWRHLLETGKSRDQVMQMAREIAAGEQTYASTDISLAEIQALLDYRPAPATGARRGATSRRPGERNPVRDPAGRTLLSGYLGEL